MTAAALKLLSKEAEREPWDDTDREYPHHVITPPSPSFLRSYVDYISDLTDAPMIYHVLSGLTMLATAAGNQLYIDAWGNWFRPNIWVVLVGESSEMRKSYSISHARRIVQKAFPERIYPNSWTVEALEGVLAEQPAGLMPVPELAHLWAAVAKDYNSSALQFLMVAYDNEPWKRVTRKDGASFINDPALSMLAGSTVDWLMQGMKSQGVASGAMARFLIVPATKKERELGLVSSRRNEILEATLVDHLKMVATLPKGGKPTEIKVPPDVASLYNGIDQRIRHDLAAGLLPRELAPIYKRMVASILKIAALYHLSEPSPTLNLSIENMYCANSLVSKLIDQVTKLFGSEVSYSQAGADRVLLLRRLREKNGKLARNELFRAVNAHMDVARFERTLAGLEMAEEVHIIKEATGGRPREVICLDEIFRSTEKTVDDADETFEAAGGRPLLSAKEMP